MSLQGEEAEDSGQPLGPARDGLPAAHRCPEGLRVPGLDHVGDGAAAEHRQDEGEYRQAGGCCPDMGEQHGEVISRLGAESAAPDDGAGQARSERSGNEHQEGDEAEGEHGGELQRAVDESELAQLLPDPARESGLEAVPRDAEHLTGHSPGIRWAAMILSELG